jgi:hypothetical protein
MHVNRLNGFFIGGTFQPGDQTMTIEERNQNSNEAMDVRFEQLKAAWEQYEQELKSMRPVDPVQVCYDEDHESSADRRYLAFWKSGGQWKIYHGHHEYGEYDEQLHWTPINEAPVRWRLTAVKHLDMLKEAIVKSKEKFIPDMDEAIASLVSQAVDLKSRRAQKQDADKA